MTRTVIFNQKGGVGKSTITCNLAAIHAHKGHPTLVIDLDPQGNSSRYLLGDNQVSSKTITAFFEQVLNFSYVSGGIESVIQETPFDNLHIITADEQLENLASKLESRHKIYKLRDELIDLNGYDAIFFDTPPALNFFSRSALIAAEGCLVPFDCDDFSRQALYRLMSNLHELRDDHNPSLQLLGIIVNQFQSQAKLPMQLIDSLIAENLPLLNPYLSSSVKVKESHQHHTPLITLYPKHKLTAELLELYHNIFSNDMAITEDSLIDAGCETA